MSDLSLSKEALVFNEPETSFVFSTALLDASVGKASLSEASESTALFCFSFYAFV